MAKKRKQEPISVPILLKMAQGLFDAIDAMSKNEIIALMDEINAVSTANVWWATYEVAQIIKERVSSILVDKEADEALKGAEHERD